jgi:hypothetical protein
MKMMPPYGFGFDPNEYKTLLDLHIDLKAMERSYRTIARKATGRTLRKAGK